jgi:hypothetical protein
LHDNEEEEDKEDNNNSAPAATNDPPAATNDPPAGNDSKDNANDSLLGSLQWDKLLTWVENHAIKVQGRCTTKKGMFHLLSNSLLIVSTDIIKVITAAPKAEQPRKEIEAIISEVSVHCCSSSIYSYIPFSTNPNTM